jgi:hypothetical protein
MVGTALLVVFGAGAVVAALQTGNGKLDYAALGIVSFSFALAVAAAIYMFGSTSGAHINPAVTVSLAAVRRFPWGEVVPYIVAQLIAWPGSSSWIRTTCSATRSGSPRSNQSMEEDGCACSAMIARRSSTSRRTSSKRGSPPIEQPCPIANA